MSQEVAIYNSTSPRCLTDTQVSELSRTTRTLCDDQEFNTAAFFRQQLLESHASRAQFMQAYLDAEFSLSDVQNMLLSLDAKLRSCS